MSEELREIVDKGERAELALKEIDEAFTALEAQCLDAFRKSDIHDEKGHRTCRLYLKVLDDVKTRFTTAVRNGEVSRKKLVTPKSPSKIRRLMNV